MVPCCVGMICLGEFGFEFVAVFPFGFLIVDFFGWA